MVFVHPAELPAPPVDGIPAFAADFLLDTTRAALPTLLAFAGCSPVGESIGWPGCRPARAVGGPEVTVAACVVQWRVSRRLP